MKNITATKLTMTNYRQNRDCKMYYVNKICNFQSWYFSDEHDGISASLENSQKMVQTCNTELNTLKGRLAAAYQQINALKESKEEVHVDALESDLAEVTHC